MTAKNRAGLITKLQTSLKKHFKPAPPTPGRPLMEHVLYAALLEDAPVDIADEGYAKCEQEFFDWNEVRVTSVTELAEVLSNFPSPAPTALRLKRCLQSVFESFYSFEIEHLKKENLSKAVAKFETMSGISPFVLSYLVQHGLGGHAIPVNTSGMWIMFKTGIVSEAEAKSGKVPGLERAIPKSKAIEFSSMLHQAAVTLAADPNSKAVWEIIWAVNKDAVMAGPQTESTRKSAKRPAPSKSSDAAKAEPKSGGKSKSSASKPASAKSEPAAKVTKPQEAKSTAKPKSAGETDKSSPAGKPAATKATTKPAADLPADASTKPEPKPKAKAKPLAAEKGKSATADTKRSGEAKKATQPKTGATKEPSTAKPAVKATTDPEAPPTASGKSSKAEAVSKEAPKTTAAKPSKKPAATKTPPTVDPTSSPQPADSTSAKPTAKKTDPGSTNDSTPTATTTAAAGNQKLTKRKPR